MSTLQTELTRLYVCPTPDGHVRALVLALARPADWSLLSSVWRGVQTDLELPAPAIAVSGIDAYQLWFSLEQPVTVADGLAFLQALCVRYLAGVAPARLGLLTGLQAPAVPAVQAATGLWSAFVAPDLAAIFADEPWLDLPPNPEAQATLLSPLARIKPAALQAAVQLLQPQAVASNGHQGSPESGAVQTLSALGEKSQDPKRFLLDVMGDPGIDLRLRIDAAKALLPYC